MEQDNKGQDEGGRKIRGRIKGVGWYGTGWRR